MRLVCVEGWSTAEAALAVGRSQRSVQLWVQKSQQGLRLDLLATQKAPGRVPRLTVKQRAKLVKLLQAGPVAAGFASSLWTAPRIGELILREFQVPYHARYLPTLLGALGFTPQKPKERAAERDERVIAEWIQRRWPTIKKKPEA